MKHLILKDRVMILILNWWKSCWTRMIFIRSILRRYWRIKPWNLYVSWCSNGVWILPSMRWGSMRIKYINILLSCCLLVVIFWIWGHIAVILIWFVCVLISYRDPLIFLISLSRNWWTRIKWSIWLQDKMLKCLLSPFSLRISILISVFVNLKRKLSQEILRELFLMTCWRILYLMMPVESHFLAGRIICWFWIWLGSSFRISSRLLGLSRFGPKIEELVPMVWATWEVFHGLFWLLRYARSFPTTSQLNCSSNSLQSTTSGTGKCQWESMLQVA